MLPPPRAKARRRWLQATCCNRPPSLAPSCFTTDVRVRCQIGKAMSAALGIDNLNNHQYWNFHPYPQRAFSAELKVNL